MRTEKHDETINFYLNAQVAETAALYREIIFCLTELGYKPVKQASSVSFKHTRHTKQIAKFGKDFFSLRFSACRGYSKRFADIVAAAVVKADAKNPANKPYHLARCLTGECNNCRGEAVLHVYAHADDDGERKTSCGCYALRIPDLSAGDIPEIKRLIREEHEYLMKNEAKIYNDI